MTERDRFINAQEKNDTYKKAYSELEKGAKVSHWIWYIFPQLKELGLSANAKYYGIKNLTEACDYLQNNVLFANYLKITRLVWQQLNEKNIPIGVLMGSPIDAAKLVSSMTLFQQVALFLANKEKDFAAYTELAQLCGRILEEANKQGYQRCSKSFNTIMLQIDHAAKQEPEPLPKTKFSNKPFIIDIRCSNGTKVSVEIMPSDTMLMVRKKALEQILKHLNAYLPDDELDESNETNQNKLIDAIAPNYKIIYKGQLFPSSEECFLTTYDISENDDVTMHIILGGCTGLHVKYNKASSASRPTSANSSDSGDPPSPKDSPSKNDHAAKNLFEQYQQYVAAIDKNSPLKKQKEAALTMAKLIIKQADDIKILGALYKKLNANELKSPFFKKERHFFRKDSGLTYSWGLVLSEIKTQAMSLAEKAYNKSFSELQSHQHLYEDIFKIRRSRIAWGKPNSLCAFEILMGNDQNKPH